MLAGFAPSLDIASSGNTGLGQDGLRGYDTNVISLGEESV
jgi:hypothetical protein